MFAHLLIILHLMASDIRLPDFIHEPLVRATDSFAPRPIALTSANASSSSTFLPEPAALPAKSSDVTLAASAKRAIVIDADSATVLFEKHADEQASIASITKLMTAMVALEQADSMEQVLTVPKSVSKLESDSTRAGLVPGEKIQVQDLMTALLVASANDAALTLASGLAGSEKDFVDLMNQKAEDLGLAHTHFANSTGLDTEDGHSTARDVAFMLKEAYKRARVRDAAQISSTSITSESGNTYYLKATDKLIGNSDLSILAAKTGLTDKTGPAFALLARASGHNLIAVVLNSQDRFGEAEKLITDAAKQFRWPSQNSSSIADEPAGQKGVDFGG